MSRLRDSGRSTSNRAASSLGRPSAFAAAWLLTLACAWPLSSCATQTFHLNSGAAEDFALEERQNFFIGGLGQLSVQETREACGDPDRVARVQAFRSLGDVLAGIATLGLYSPAHVRVHCVDE